MNCALWLMTSGIMCITRGCCFMSSGIQFVSWVCLSSVIRGIPDSKLESGLVWFGIAFNSVAFGCTLIVRTQCSA